MSLRDVGAVKDTTSVTLYHPATGKPLLNADKSPMTVLVHGPYSKRYKAVLREQQQARVNDMARGTRRATLDSDEIDAMSNELLVRCVESWDVTLEGDKKLPFSQEAVQSVFAEFPWLRDQLQAVMGNAADFLEPPKKL